MGFYPQPNRWQCGPFALKHALAIFGRFVDEQELTRIAGTTKEGTDERMLIKAADALECRLIELRETDEYSAYDAITEYLDKGFPCLICINQWGHWVTVVHHDADKDLFVVIDSEKDPVVRLPNWEELRKRWVYNENTAEGELKQYFDFYPLKPRFRNRTQANFSLSRAQTLRKASNASFVMHFDEYVSDLLAITRPRSSRGKSYDVMSMAEFLRRHRRILLEAARHWHRSIPASELSKVLSNMKFVAETYGLTIRTADEKRTIAAMSALLSTWATSHEPLEALYGED